MRSILSFLVLTFIGAPGILMGQSGPEGELLACWNFDSIGPGGLVIEEISGAKSPGGHITLSQGVSGNAIRLDGYKSRIASAPIRFNGDSGFYLEAWLALQAYPWNRSPVIHQGTPCSSGDDTGCSTDLFLGVDAYGHLVFDLKAGGELLSCRSKEALDLLNWNHVAASCGPERGMQLFVNGEEVARLGYQATIGPAGGAELLLGMNLEQMGPEGSERKASAELPSRMVLHGLLDELRVFSRAKDGQEVMARYERSKPDQLKPLSWQILPSGPDSLSPDFHAHLTRLRYADEWEAGQIVGEHPDILVQFDQAPVRCLFWRGTGYGAVWVSENGIWMADQSLERANRGKSPMGCSEHMSDKQNRYSHVRILENTDARIVIHWRYAIADILYDIFGIDEDHPAGEWADEYYYIYPDGVCVRHQVLWSDHLSHEWQETIVINQAGTRPEDNIQLEAMTLMNMDGASRTYSWENGGPASFPEPEDANIQLVNLRSAWRPYIIFEPEPGIRPFSPGAIRPGYSHFPWWNHWPVAQIPNDGRKAFAPDRPSHSSLSQSIEGSGVIHENADGSFEVITLTGMTDDPEGSLVPLARSWNHAPRLVPQGKDIVASSYLKQERAYLISLESDPSEALSFTIIASEQTPLVHPAFVIENWGGMMPVLEIEGIELVTGTDYSYGFRKTLSGRDLILWTNIKASSSTRFLLSQSSLLMQ